MFRQKMIEVRWIEGIVQFERVCEDQLVLGGLSSYFDICAAIFTAQNPFG
ncbi:MAG: hypothetical protein AABW64_03235 [Nanoarchaeota archaeon]